MLIALRLMFALLLDLDVYCVYIAIVCDWFADIGLIVLIYYCVLLMWGWVDCYVVCTVTC